MGEGKVLSIYRRKVILDSSIYIAHLARNLYPDLPGLSQTLFLPYLSSVVFHELASGYRTDKERKRLEELREGFERTDRIVTPTKSHWEESGWILAKIFKKGGSSRISLTHDILIALSARSIGATVITENRRDFEKIRSYRDFSLEIWPRVLPEGVLS